MKKDPENGKESGPAGFPGGIAPAFGAPGAGEDASSTPESRSGPSWRGWALSIVAAAVLAAAAMLLLGGFVRVGPSLPQAVGHTGAGDPCCPPGRR